MPKELSEENIATQSSKKIAYYDLLHSKVDEHDDKPIIIAKFKGENKKFHS